MSDYIGLSDTPSPLFYRYTCSSDGPACQEGISEKTQVREEMKI